ncbi:PIN domain-containing protein [Paenibacillus sp. G2S3]|uniref:PIN domain-containing protein n=1 Tax=Paenibacillus sp. G2S3 TaxID=3047872 RepID=UPI0024C15357|nr:PIN domain-containing protein [Paenibacillus sp. G2S3]WHY22193.1 PIN domain-containing protein [Paenibacillus sp. G2S3]
MYRGPKPSVVIDTCIWIDLVKGKYEKRMLTILENLVMDYHIKLVVPTQIAHEWNRIKNERILVATDHYLNAAKNTINEALKIAKSSKHTEISAQLELSMTLLKELKPAILQEYTDLSQRIDNLFNSKKTVHINLSEAKKSSLIDDVLMNKEPFFKKDKKKSMGDAVIFFSILEYMDDSNQELYFISSNTEDFGKDQLDINLQEIVDDNFKYYRSLPAAIESLEEWSEEVKAYLQSEEEAEQMRQESDWRNAILTIGNCDDCGAENVPGRYAYISGDLAVLAFCLNCNPFPLN